MLNPIITLVLFSQVNFTHTTIKYLSLSLFLTTQNLSPICDWFQESWMEHQHKIALLFSHKDWFSENPGSMNDKQGERFHQNMKEKSKYQGRSSAVMMAD